MRYCLLGPTCSEQAVGFFARQRVWWSCLRAATVTTALLRYHVCYHVREMRTNRVACRMSALSSELEGGTLNAAVGHWTAEHRECALVGAVPGHSRAEMAGACQATRVFTQRTIL